MAGREKFYDLSQISQKLTAGAVSTPGRRLDRGNEPLLEDPESLMVTPFPVARHLYKGPMYFQGNEPTCVAWSLANATKALGQEVEPGLLVNLVNAALSTNGKGYGLREKEFREIFKRHRRSSDIDLYSPATTLGFIRTDDRRRSGTKVELNPTEFNIVCRNGNAIQQVVNRGRVMMVSVRVGAYTGTFDYSDLHAVCITGYNIDKKGAMMVQVIDSARGEIFIPIEHLTESLTLDMSWRYIVQPYRM